MATHKEVSERLSACFSTGFNHASSAIDYGFRVLLLVSAWLFFAAGRVLLALGRALQAAEFEYERALPARIRETALRAAGAPSAQEQRQALADLIRARDADREVLQALQQKKVIPIKFRPKGMIQKWYVPADEGWNEVERPVGFNRLLGASIQSMTTEIIELLGMDPATVPLATKGSIGVLLTGKFEDFLQLYLSAEKRTS